MQMLKENQNNSNSNLSLRGSKSIKTEGNFDDRSYRGEHSSYERNMTQVNESPIRRSQIFQQQQQLQPQRSGRSISCASQKSQQNTQRDDILGSLHSPNFAQNLEQISQRFESYRNGGPLIADHQVYDQQNVVVSQNLRQAFEQKLNNAQNLQHQSLQQQQLLHSRSNSINSNYSTINQGQNYMTSSGVNNINRKKIFDNPLPPPPIKANVLNTQLNANKGKPLNSGRTYQNSSNKENMNKNIPNMVYSSQDDYSSITSNSNKEVDLEKANEKIQYLDQNLRREMLNSEEQRSQISILKNELERKLNDNGFMNFFKTANSSHNLSHIDIYMELQVIKQKLLEKEEKLQVFQKDSGFQEIQQIKERNRQLEQQNSNFKEQLELLRFDRNDLEDLKAEKQNLIDFVEKLKSENEKLEEDLSNVDQKYMSKQDQGELKQLKEQNEYLIEENRAKDQEIELLNESISQIHLLREQIEKHRLNLIEQNKQLNDEVQQANAKFEQLQSEQNNSDNDLQQQQQLNEVLQDQVSSLKEEIQENNSQFESKLEEFENIIEQLQAEKKILLENDAKKQQEINNQQEQIQSFKQSVQSSTFIQNQFESYKQKFEDAKDNIYTLTQTLEETNNELEKVQTKCNNFEQIAKEKNTIIVQKEDSIKQLNESIQNIERENEYLKRKLQEEMKDSKEKQAQQFYSEKRNLSLQLEHQKSQNLIFEKKIQEQEVMIDKLRIELSNNQDDSESVQTLKMKLQQTAEYYEKRLKDAKQTQFSRRQDQISLQVQITMISDTIKSLSNYIKDNCISDLDITHMIEDLEYQIEEIQNLVHDSSQQQSTQITQRSSYQSLHQNFQLNNQHKSRDMDELKVILSMKDREIQALKKDQQDHQMSYAQQYQKHERSNKQNEFLHGGYYSGKGSKNYFS